MEAHAFNLSRDRQNPEFETKQVPGQLGLPGVTLSPKTKQAITKNKIKKQSKPGCGGTCL